MSDVAGDGVRPVLVVEHGDDAPLGRMAAPLAAEVPVDLRRAHAGEPLPTDLTGHSALLVLGGQMAAWEDDAAPWLPATRELLAAAAREQVPTLGVCLGAQLLAMATGGRVERGPAGPEAGLLPVRATPGAAGDPLLDPLTEGPWLVAQAHGDAVTALPPGAVLLASSDAYPVQAFRVGTAAWGVQYHPEVTPGQLAAWLADLGPALAARGTDAGEQLALVAEHEAALAGLAEHHSRHLSRLAQGSEGHRTAGAAR